MTDAIEIANKWHEWWADKSLRLTTWGAIDGAVREAIHSEQIAHTAALAAKDAEIAHLNSRFNVAEFMHSVRVDQASDMATANLRLHDQIQQQAAEIERLSEKVDHFELVASNNQMPTAGAIKPMIAESWRYGFNGIHFGLMENGPFIAYECYEESAKKIEQLQAEVEKERGDTLIALRVLVNTKKECEQQAAEIERLNTELLAERMACNGFRKRAVDQDKQIEQLQARVNRMQKAIDDLYNHNEATRSAVILYYGINHNIDMRINHPGG